MIRTIELDLVTLQVLIAATIIFKKFYVAKRLQTRGESKRATS